MRVLRSRLKDIGPFADYTLDVEGAEGTVVAVCAPNGSGKTCALEMAWLGTLYRDTQTQGSLLDRATSRDAFVETDVEIEDGQVYTIRHLADSVSKKSESIVLRKGETEPLWKGSKVSTYDKWAERTLLPQDVLTSTVFSVQGASGFIGLGSAARISVILKAVGVARIERMAELARAGKKKTEQELKTAVIRVNDAVAAIPDVVELERCKAIAEGDIETLAEQVALKQTDLEAARAMSSDSAIARARYLEQVDHRKGIESRIDVLDKDVTEARSQIAACDVEGSKRRAEHSAKRAVAAAEALRATTVAAEDARAKAAEAQQRTAVIERVSGELRRAEERTAKTQVLVANNQYVLDNAEELRAAVAKTESLRVEIQALEISIAEQRGLVERHKAEATSHVLNHDRHVNEASNAEQRIQRATKALEKREQVDAAVAQLESVKERLEAARLDEMAAEKKLDALRGKRIAGAEERIGNLRSGLESIRDVEQPEAKYCAQVARESLRRDDETIEMAAALPGLIVAAEAELTKKHAYLLECDSAVRVLVDLAAQEPVIREAELELASARSARDAAVALAAEQDARAKECERQAQLVEIARKANVARRDIAQAAVTELAPLVKRAAGLEGAAERLEERKAQLEQERTDVDRLKAELAALPEAEKVPVEPDVDTVRRHAEEAAEQAKADAADAVRVATKLEQLTPQLARLEAELAAAKATLAATPIPVPPGEEPNLAALEEVLQKLRDSYDYALREFGALETRIAQATEQKANAEVLESEVLALETELADWTRLALDLGRDGIQAAEVDSAGPELTELTNDLLLSCHGPRYTVSIETKRSKANGHGSTDECRVMVRDAHDNSEREARLHSGGEVVILSEAVSLALTMMACRRSGVRGATLVRDESGAALDPKNARVYLDMLRHAAQVAHASKILFVTHNPEVQLMADSVLEIRRGE